MLHAARNLGVTSVGVDDQKMKGQDVLDHHQVVKPTEANGKARTDFSFRIPRENQPCCHLDLGHPASRIYEDKTFLLCKPLHL